MTNEHILKCVKSIFGKEIVKNAYAEDLGAYDEKIDVITEKDINLGKMVINVEFITGTTVEIWSTEAGGVSKI